MFDIGSAVVLGLVLTGLVTLARTFVEGPNKSRIVAGLCLVLSVIAVLLVSASDFASEQVVLERSLDSLNVFSQLVVAVLLAGVASGIWEGLTAIKNIGENQKVQQVPTPVDFGTPR